MPLAVRIEGTQFRDSNNREFTLHGINVAGDAKNPSSPDQPSHEPDGFFKGDDVSFVGRPFSVDDAPLHFARLRSWGYNTIRYIFTWEAISHAGPELYDEAWIDYTIEVLRVAKRYGFLVFMDPHQDVVRWSSDRPPSFSCRSQVLTIVVAFYRRFRSAALDHICMWSRSRKVLGHRICFGAEHMARSKRIP